MARLIIIAAVLLIALGALLFWLNRPVSLEAQAALQQWLTSDCRVGEGQRAEMDLRRFASVLEGPLIEIAEHGPPKADIDATEAAARRRFAEIRTVLRSGRKTGLPPLAVTALVVETDSAYVTRARQDFVDGQISAALAGLRVTGGFRARRLLERFSADPKSPYRDIARLPRGR
jgi:hypothetical protein